MKKGQEKRGRRTGYESDQAAGNIVPNDHSREGFIRELFSKDGVDPKDIVQLFKETLHDPNEARKTKLTVTDAIIGLAGWMAPTKSDGDETLRRVKNLSNHDLERFLKTKDMSILFEGDTGTPVGDAIRGATEGNLVIQERVENAEQVDGEEKRGAEEKETPSLAGIEEESRDGGAGVVEPGSVPATPVAPDGVGDGDGEHGAAEVGGGRPGGVGDVAPARGQVGTVPTEPAECGGILSAETIPDVKIEVPSIPGGEPKRKDDDWGGGLSATMFGPPSDKTKALAP